MSPSIFFINIHFLNKKYHAIASIGARRWGARVGRRPPPPPSEFFFLLYWGPFCYVFLIWTENTDTTEFQSLGAFSPYGGLFATFHFKVGAFFGLPPPLRKFLRAPMIARRVREHAPRKFFCATAIYWVLDMFCYNFALKMTKIMINCSHLPARWVWRHAITRKMLVNGAIWSVFWYNFSLRKF